MKSSLQLQTYPKGFSEVVQILELVGTKMKSKRVYCTFVYMHLPS